MTVVVSNKATTHTDMYNRLLFEENVVIFKPKWLVDDHQGTKFTFLNPYICCLNYVITNCSAALNIATARKINILLLLSSLVNGPNKLESIFKSPMGVEPMTFHIWVKYPCHRATCTVIPHFTDTHLSWTPSYSTCIYIVQTVKPHFTDTHLLPTVVFVCDPSDLLSYKVNLALQTLVVCLLYKSNIK